MKANFLLFLSLFIGLSVFSQPETNPENEARLYRIEKIFPNPVENHVFVEIDAIDIATANFELVDILGNMVHKWEPIHLTPGNQQLKLQIKNIHTGIYLLRARIEGEIYVFRIRKV